MLHKLCCNLTKWNWHYKTIKAGKNLENENSLPDFICEAVDGIDLPNLVCSWWNMAECRGRKQLNKSWKNRHETKENDGKRHELKQDETNWTEMKRKRTRINVFFSIVRRGVYNFIFFIFSPPPIFFLNSFPILDDSKDRLNSS